MKLLRSSLLLLLALGPASRAEVQESPHLVLIPRTIISAPLESFSLMDFDQRAARFFAGSWNFYIGARLTYGLEQERDARPSETRWSKPILVAYGERREDFENPVVCVRLSDLVPSAHRIRRWEYRDVELLYSERYSIQASQTISVGGLLSRNQWIELNAVSGTEQVRIETRLIAGNDPLLSRCPR